MSETSQPGNNGPGQIISSVRSIRLAIFLITTSLIATCAVFNVIDFNSNASDYPREIILDVSEFNNTNLTSTTLPFSTSIDVEIPPIRLDIPPIYLFLCGLSLSAISAFLHAGFILKLSMMIITVIIQTVILYTSETFQDYEAFSGELNV
jgi:adenylate cyclase 2